MHRFLLLICALAVSSTAQAKYVSKVFGCKKGNVCVVHNNLGGDFGDYISAVTEIRKKETLLVIDGPCWSMCAAVADMVRPNTCITKNAYFGFHQVAWSEKGKPTYYTLPPRSRVTSEWNLKKGGYPIIGYNVMSFPETLDYWPLCAKVPFPRSDPRKSITAAH